MTWPCYKVAFELAGERTRQIMTKGWTVEHDDAYTLGEMGTAAQCYIGISQAENELFIATSKPGRLWPWLAIWWKPRNRRRALVKAGALIIAEIERLDRIEAHDWKNITDTSATSGSVTGRIQHG